MLKKNEIKREVIVAEALALENDMAKYTHVSLRKIATELDISYPVLLKASKAPKVGEMYDPGAVNYEAVAVEILKREKSSMNLDWALLDEVATNRGGVVVKDISKFTVGTEVYLRDNPSTPYFVIYTTATHVVIMLEGTEEPRVLSWNTFLMKGPSFIPRAEKVTVEEDDM